MSSKTKEFIFNLNHSSEDIIRRLDQGIFDIGNSEMFPSFRKELNK